jgi:hypothetical protein
MAEPSHIPFEVVEVFYYGSIWTISFLCCVSQTLLTRNYRNCWHAINCGVVAGFCGVAVVASFAGDHDSRAGHEINYVPLAIVVGLAVGFQEGYARVLISKLLEKIGLPPFKDEPNTPPPCSPLPDHCTDSVVDHIRDVVPVDGTSILRPPIEPQPPTHNTDNIQPPGP